MKFTHFLDQVLLDQSNEQQSAYINCDVTLFIRLLEIAREELKTDADLHKLVERCSSRFAEKGAALTMDDYDSLWSSKNES